MGCPGTAYPEPALLGQWYGQCLRGFPNVTERANLERCYVLIEYRDPTWVHGVCVTGTGLLLMAAAGLVFGCVTEAVDADRRAYLLRIGLSEGDPLVLRADAVLTRYGRDQATDLSSLKSILHAHDRYAAHKAAKQRRKDYAKDMFA